MNGSHARFFLKKMDNSLLGVGPRSNLVCSAIDNILVNGAHVESFIPSKSASMTLRLALNVITVYVSSIIDFLGVVGGWSLFFGVTEL